MNELSAAVPSNLHQQLQS